MELKEESNDKDTVVREIAKHQLANLRLPGDPGYKKPENAESEKSKKRGKE